MFEKLRSFLSRTNLDAATQLTPVAPIKAKPGSRAWPAFFTSTKPSKDAITRPDRRLINTDVLSYRNGASTHKVLQDMVASSPELSSAVYTAIRLGVPEKYVAIARTMEGAIDPKATALLQSLITRFDVIGDPLEGYTGTGSLKSVSEFLAKDIVMYGTMACELVLDKSRLPYRLQPISSTVVQFKADGKGVKPFQKVGEDELDLDIPTVAIIQLDNNGLSPYSASPLEPALKAVVFSETFMADLTRVMRKAIHPRLKVKVSEEMVRKYLSPEAQMDEEKARKELATMTSDIESKVNNLQPEDALVYLDSLGFEVETPTGSGDDYAILRQIANAKLASGSKTLPSVLGLESGSASSNIASTEVAIYLRSLDSAIRQKLNEIYSRLFTVAIRLLGVDGFVTFEYEALSIRPASELAAHRQTEMAMILDKLSLGLLDDNEASLILTGKLPPPGFKPLSGTMFRHGGQATALEDDPSDNQVEDPSNSGSTLNQKIKSDQPAQGRGGNKKAPAN